MTTFEMLAVTEDQNGQVEDLDSLGECIIDTTRPLKAQVVKAFTNLGIDTPKELTIIDMSDTIGIIEVYSGNDYVYQLRD